MNYNSVMLKLVRSGARRAVLFTRHNTFDISEATDLNIVRCNQGLLVSKERINIDYYVSDKDLAYYLGMIFIEGEKFYDYTKERVSCRIATLEGVHVHAELHQLTHVSKYELTKHVIQMVDRFNKVDGILCSYKIERNNGTLARYNFLVNNDRKAILKDFAAYYNDLWNEVDKLEEHPIYSSLINMDIHTLRDFYRTYMIKPPNW